MRVGKEMGNGLKACEDALSRLLSCTPFVSAHVGLDLARLTPSIVSLEAGFDRGYLKKSRKNHLPLLAKIEASRKGRSHVDNITSSAVLQRYERKILILEKEVALVVAQRDRVLEQNLKLWERLRELEIVGEVKGSAQKNNIYCI